MDDKTSILTKWRVVLDVMRIITERNLNDDTYQCQAEKLRTLFLNFDLNQVVGPSTEFIGIRSEIQSVG